MFVHLSFKQAWHLFFCKDSANEWNNKEKTFSFCFRVQPILFKDSANERYVKTKKTFLGSIIFGSSDIWSEEDAISLHNISKTAVTCIQACSWFFPCPLHVRYIWLRERKPNEGRTKDERRSNGELTETYRTSNEKRTENASGKSRRKDNTSAKNIFHILVDNGR